MSEYLPPEEMEARLNERFFSDEADRVYYKLRYGNELKFVSSMAEFAFHIPDFGVHTCYGAIFIHYSFNGSLGRFMDEEVWSAVVEMAGGQERTVYEEETKKECKAALYRGIMFIYANHCIFFTYPLDDKAVGPSNKI